MRVLSFGGHFGESRGDPEWIGERGGMEVRRVGSQFEFAVLDRSRIMFKMLTAEEAESLREFLKPVPIAPLAEDLTESLGYHGPKARDLK